MAGADRAALRGGLVRDPPPGHSGVGGSAADPAVPGLGGTSVAKLVAAFGERMRAAELDGLDQAALEPWLNIFLRGGGEALKAAIARDRWVQVSLAPAGPAFAPPLFSRLLRFVEALLAADEIENFFFMFKPPGLRLRFEASDAGPRLARCIEAGLAQWCHEGLAARGYSGVYEPEAQLFGGPVSMRHVDAIFTLDSLVWLAFHGEDRRGGGMDSWQVSFAVLRALFDGLGIVGWEDIGVFTHVRDQMGRRLPDATAGQPDRVALESEVVARWDDAAGSAERLGPGSALAASLVAMAAAGAQWKRGYFDTPGATIGPRQGAAYAAIFHWNRAGLSAPQQALIAETLAGRRVTRNAGNASR